MQEDVEISSMGFKERGQADKMSHSIVMVSPEPEVTQSNEDEVR